MKKLLCLLMTAPMACAAVLIDDNFAGATGNPNDWNYYLAARVTGDHVSTLAFANDEMRFTVTTNSSDDNQGFFIQFPETTLADGEILRMTLDIGAAALGSTTQQLQLTLANSANSFSENVGTNSWTDTDRYSTWIGAGGTNNSRVRAGSTGASPTYLAGSSDFGPSSTAAVAGSNRIIVFEVLRVNEEDHRLSVFIDETVLFDKIQAPSNRNFSTFNTLGVSIRSAGGTIERNIGLNGIKLEVIPEPTTAGLVLAGLVVLAAKLRRRGGKE